MIGEVLGNYRVKAEIGSGGMGIVYSAEHILLGKPAAIKVLKPDRCASAEIVERFFNEARAASLVNDPGIPQVIDYGRLRTGNAYLVMEMLEGETLGDILRTHPRLSPGRSLALARLIAGTLDATHRRGIIHRDLKPDNVFVVADAAMPRGERVKILDFGIAKLQGEGLSSLQTETGRLMGTPYYMSPEQCRGAGDIDHRTDIYSLGCVLYQMLTGRPPFAMEGGGEVLAAHIHLNPKPIGQVEPQLPRELCELVMDLLAKDRSERPSTMGHVMERINAIASYTELSTPEPSLQRSQESPLGVDGFGDTVHDSTEFERANTTTLEASSGEFHTYQFLTDQCATKGKPLLLYATALVGLLFGSWGVYTVLDKAPPLKPVAAAAPEQATPPEPSPIIVKQLVEVPSEPEFVEVTITSEPEGARVFRRSDKMQVGRTPMAIQLRRGEVGEFFLTKTGYQRYDVDLTTSLPTPKAVTLEPRKKGSTEKVAKVPTVERESRLDEVAETGNAPALRPSSEETGAGMPSNPAP